MQKKNNTPFPKRNLGGHWLPPALHPDPILAAEGLSATFPVRFLSKIKQTETCFRWTGSFGDRLTPRILRGARRSGNISALAASWILYNGEIPEGMKVFRSCPFGSRTCLHPNRLVIGYQRDMAKLHVAVTKHEPLSSEQLERINKLFKEAGESMDKVMAELMAGHVTPQWMIDLGYSETFAARFFSKVEITESCHLWKGALGSDGYGSIGTCSVNGSSRHVGAHVASYMLHKGRIPKGQHVCHNCPGGDNPQCVNPAHLWLGSRSQNAEDAANKRTAAGKSNPNSKLTIEQRAELKERFANGETKAALARRFNISPIRVHYILTRRNSSDTFIWKLAGSLPHGTRTGNTISQSQRLIFMS